MMKLKNLIINTDSTAKEIVQNWEDMLKYVYDVLLSFPEEKTAIEELNRIEEWLGSLQITTENYGLIHYDFELDNVFWDEQVNSFNIIDFDDCIYHWFVMDIVFALRDLEEFGEEESHRNSLAFLNDYRSIRNIEEDFIGLIPRFRRYSNLITFAKLLRTLKDSNFLEEPDWLKKLRPRLEGNLILDLQ